MGIDLQVLYTLADGVEEPQSQQERHHPWAQEIELLRKLGVRMIDKEQDLDKPRMFPELELTEEPRGIPDMDVDSTRYVDDTRKPGDPAQWKDDSTRYDNGTPKPVETMKR